jgi:hypothetical protein
MLRNIPVILVLLFPAAAVAEQAAVLPVSYKFYRTANQSQERADKVLETVKTTVEKIGMVPVSVDSDGFCEDEACVQATAEKTGADFCVQVSVVDNDGQFDIKVLVNGAEPAAASPFGTFNSMIQRVAGLVEASLNEAKAKKPVEPAATEQPAEPEPIAATQEPVPTTPPPTTPPKADDAKHKPLKPAVFYSLLGVTVGLGGALAAVEAVNYQKWKDAGKPSDLTSQMNHLQVASIALIGCTAAAGVATIVIAVLTDFKSKKGDKISLAPMISDRAQGPGAQGLMIQGEF